ALGYQGCKVETQGEYGKDTFYFVLEGNEPVLWFVTGGEAWEADLDNDGERELVTHLDHTFHIYDRMVEDYTVYTVADTLDDGSTLAYDEGVFILTTPVGREYTYVHLWNGQLSRWQPDAGA
ncbi:MAG: hypothetical protein IJX52_04085, partial [Oscillibacter sp.]|nr:hypothetical protein [Oscillibacter sp.]